MLERLHMLHAEAQEERTNANHRPFAVFGKSESEISSPSIKGMH
jgi:hypothetical protein